MSNSLADFAVDKSKHVVEGFVPRIVKAVGYGTVIETDPSTGNPGLKPVPVEVIMGEVGRERVEDNPECYAKALLFEGEDKYVCYLRVNVHGEIADPWGIFTNETQNRRFANHRGRPAWQFTRVTESVFMLYLKYLVSRNPSHLRLCDREMKNG